MSVLDAFAAEIQNVEGYYPGSRAYRNNNPGNIKPGNLNLGQVGLDSAGFAVFSSYAAGYQALINDIAAKFSGHTRSGLGPASSVYQFFTVYAPSSDNNNPRSYAQTVVNGLNASYGSSLTIDSSLSDVMSLDSGNPSPTAYTLDSSGSTDSTGTYTLDNFGNVVPVDNSASQTPENDDMLAAVFF